MCDLQPQAEPIWQGDLLNRKDIAEYLTNYLIERYQTNLATEQGFVLAINAEWGFGKTFLMKNWVCELQQSNYAAVYFDAWQNDFTSEPLVAFIAEIDESLKPVFKNIPAAKKLLRDTVSKAKQLWKPAGKAAVEILLKRGIGVTVQEAQNLLEQHSVENSRGDNKVGEEILTALTKAYESTLEDHLNKKRAISAFREKLSQLIRALESSKKIQLPIFFFVDELDRCRPNYAIELLEGIKHLFGVSGVYFVIGVNLNQLGETTKAIYGAGFDGSRYLKRFFDLEYSLPPPNDGPSYAESLFNSSTLREQNIFITRLPKEFYGDKQLASQLFAMYSEFFGLGLRDQQHVIRHIEASVAAITTPRAHAHYLFFLVMLNYKFPESFEAIFERSIDQNNVKPLDQQNFTAEVSKFLRKPVFIRRKRNGGTFSLEDVAWFYLKTARRDLKDLFKDEANEDDFPPNLIIDLRTEMPSHSVHGKFNTSSIAGYPKLVRQAGYFK